MAVGLKHRRAAAPIITVAALAGFCMAGTPAQATEGGASIYLLGSGGADAAVQPPVEGVYIDSTYYVYDGSVDADKNLVVGGKVAAGLKSTIVAQFVTLLWVPSTNFLGGTLALGPALPVAAPMVNADISVTGPLGNSISRTVRDSTLTVGDPLMNASLGWTWDKLHLTASGFVNIPVGHYREDQLANISFHRWAGDASLAASWHDTQSGWDVSAKAGVTFNGNNDYTDYNSGNNFHLEGAVEKTFSPKFSAGVQGYWYKQISADTGAGAKLGSFEGEVAALGGTLAYNTVLGRSPTTFRLRVLQEFDAKRRQEGTVAMFSVTVPLKMNLPPQAEQPAQ
ncbi:transporter [Novosphingobium sp. BL-8H]|uniref:SphA family protein n=1 Tax=Novosphingobium sp. BL-8H TaxID=3127640 RepID=UPI003758280F